MADMLVEGPAIYWCHLNFFLFCLFLLVYEGGCSLLETFKVLVVALWSRGWFSVARTFELWNRETSLGIRIEPTSSSDTYKDVYEEASSTDSCCVCAKCYLCLCQSACPQQRHTLNVIFFSFSRLFARLCRKIYRFSKTVILSHSDQPLTGRFLLYLSGLWFFFLSLPVTHSQGHWSLLTTYSSKG